MIYKNKRGNASFEHLPTIIVVLLLIVAGILAVRAIQKNQGNVDNQTNNLCELANGKCFKPENDACPDGRTKLSQTGCPQTKDKSPVEQYCCQRLPSDAT